MFRDHCTAPKSCNNPKKPTEPHAIPLVAQGAYESRCSPPAGYARSRQVHTSGKQVRRDSWSSHGYQGPRTSLATTTSRNPSNSALPTRGRELDHCSPLAEYVHPNVVNYTERRSGGAGLRGEYLELPCSSDGAVRRSRGVPTRSQPALLHATDSSAGVFPFPRGPEGTGRQGRTGAARGPLVHPRKTIGEPDFPAFVLARTFRSFHGAPHPRYYAGTFSCQTYPREYPPPAPPPRAHSVAP
ncbi:hypothetical protein KM043_015443 [Ampulex compressa]|nr:hypothetical protein KM043_015443 [Ampulex compressa]